MANGNDVDSSILYVSLIAGMYVHDVSAVHMMTPDVSTYKLTFANSSSPYMSEMDINLPSDVMLKSSAMSLTYKGTIDGGTAANPTFTPEAVIGDTYKVSAAGYINATSVEAGDMLTCIDDTSAAEESTKTTVDANWNYVQGNISASTFAKTGHFHDISYGSVTAAGGDVVPAGTVSKPAITPNNTFGAISYMEDCTCTLNTSVTDLGMVMNGWIYDSSDETMSFGTTSFSYVQATDASMTNTVKSFSAVTGASPELSEAPVFTGEALQQHTHGFAVNVSTGVDQMPE